MVGICIATQSFTVTVAGLVVQLLLPLSVIVNCFPNQSTV